MGKIPLPYTENGRKWEAKVSDFKNHQRFSLRCLDKGLVPVSLKLKNMIRTQRGKGIIQKAEKQLLNERIKNINYTLKHYEHDRYMYKRELKSFQNKTRKYGMHVWKKLRKEKNLDTKESWRYK